MLLGDLNSQPDSDEMRMLRGLAPVPVPGVVFRDAWELAGDGPGLTFDRRNPFAGATLNVDERIDYVYVAAPKANGCGNVLRTRLIGDEPRDGMWGSDHFGVCSDLRY